MAGKRKTEEGGTAVLDAPAEGTHASGGRAVLTIDAATVEPSQAEAKGTFAMLPLDAIAESPWNPRKHFDPKELAELTASVALDGVWEPVLVRPHASGDGVFELASGHRRFRASKAAGRTHIPALIRELNDETFLKLLTIANLQREDVHPLEQADAFATQMREFGWKPDRIARECGRGETFVYDHLKFLTLIPAVRDLFFADRISTAHAVELTRLTPAQQEQAIDPIDGGLWEAAQLSRADEDQLALDDEAQASDPYAGMKTVTFRELRGWIQDYLRFDVAAADPVLFPSATLVQAAIEEKIKVVSITWDRYPRDEAKKAADEKIFTPLHWRRADGQQGSSTCEYAAKSIGVVVVGPGQGESFAICRAREKCEVHFGEEIREKAKAAKAAAKSGKSTATKKPSAPREEPWERAQRLRDAKRDAFRPAFLAVREALVAKLKALPFKMGGPLTQLAERDLRLSSEARKAVGEIKSAEDLLRAVAIDQVLEVGDHFAYERLPEIGKVIGVDVAKLVKAHTPAAETPAAAEKAKPAAKKKGAKR